MLITPVDIRDILQPQPHHTQAEYVVGSEVRPCPYAGKQFKITLTYPAEYPHKAPEVCDKWDLLLHVEQQVTSASADMFAPGDHTILAYCTAIQQMKFQTGLLYHPNVNNETGEMCMEGIDSPSLTIDGRAAHIFKFLSQPNLGMSSRCCACVRARAMVQLWRMTTTPAAAAAAVFCRLSSRCRLCCSDVQRYQQV